MPRKKPAEQRDRDHAEQEPQVLDVRADVRADLLDGVRAGVRMTLRGKPGALRPLGC